MTRVLRPSSIGIASLCALLSTASACSGDAAPPAAAKTGAGSTAGDATASNTPASSAGTDASTAGPTEGAATAGGPAPTTAADAGEPKEVDTAPPTDDPVPPPDPSTEGAATAGAATDGATDAAAAAETAAKIDALLAEVKNKKTKDDRAIAALDEAKALGAEAKTLAEAATKRGKTLVTEVERATRFFEWARITDDKWPDATFELAKFACNTGDIETTITLLTEVKARGGKKLLKTVEYDPTFALVAHDAEVLKLIK